MSEQLLRVLEDALAAVVFAREAVEMEEPELAAELLRDLDKNLASVLNRERS